MERSIQTPDKEWLTRREAARWLNIGVDSFDKLVERENLLPIVIGPKSHRWHWMDVVALAHLLTRRVAPKE